MSGFKKIAKNMLITAGILCTGFIISLFMQKMNIEETVAIIFVFAVFLISFWTDGYIYGIVASIISVASVNFAFTVPFFEISALPVNVFSAVVMVLISLLTSALINKARNHDTIMAENEKERMRGNLLRSVSHDLRTPLTNIYGSSAALLENRDTLSDEQQQKMLEGIKQDSEWLIRIVENLLSITKIGEGKIKIIKTPTVLDELVDSVIVKFKKRYPEQEVDLDLPEDIVVIPMDALLIEQVIINILENAVQHALGMTRMTLRVFTLGQQAIFEISDNGCGVRADRLNTIFDGFYESKERLVDSKKRNAGIGLSVCASIVRAHGGSITAENRKGGGAIFRFILNTENVNDGQ